MDKKNEVLDLSFDFALSIIKYCDTLEERRKYVLARQLLRAGTSIEANIREAQNPHSRADFIAKLVIAAREASETDYWLQLCDKSEQYPDPGGLLNQILSLKKLLSKIISTAKRGKP